MSVWKADLHARYFKGSPSNTDGSGGGSRLKHAFGEYVPMSLFILLINIFSASTYSVNLLSSNPKSLG